MKKGEKRRKGRREKERVETDNYTAENAEFFRDSLTGTQANNHGLY